MLQKRKPLSKGQMKAVVLIATCLLALVVEVVVAKGCAAITRKTAAPQGVATPVVTAAPEATKAPTAEPTAEPTATPTAEPTATPAPTATPKPTATPEINPACLLEMKGIERRLQPEHIVLMAKVVYHEASCCMEADQRACVDCLLNRMNTAELCWKFCDTDNHDRAWKAIVNSSENFDENNGYPLTLLGLVQDEISRWANGQAQLPEEYVSWWGNHGETEGRWFNTFVQSEAERENRKSEKAYRVSVSGDWQVLAVYEATP